MGGGLMQLVAYGAQDIYLTGNPQITFFKVVYRRHTNFSMESIKQTFDGTANYGGSVSATISRNGDLVYRMYLEHDASLKATNASDSDTDTDTLGVGCDYGSHVMKECELEIGGQKIDKHYGHWHSVYSQLTQFNPSGSKHILYNYMTGNGPSTSMKADHPTDGAPGWIRTGDGGAVVATAKGKFWIPFYFWFCRNPGLALPLIALQYHEVKVKITFEDIKNLGGIAKGRNHFNDTDNTHNSDLTVEANTEPSETKFALWCDYIYLDTDERRRFAQVSHEYLIEQLQYSSLSGKKKYELHLNHPVKELIWSGPRSRGRIENQGFGDTTMGHAADHELFERQNISGAGKFQLKLNGHDRFKERDYKYFTRTQVWEHHTGYGSRPVAEAFASGVLKGNDTIAVYSFALKPEEHQPSGTCNFSRIDNAELIMTGDATDLNLYAVNYNVLRIMSGMGGLAYSN